MVSIYGVPEEYRVYIYSALGLMFGGVILLIVSLFDMNALLLAASLTTVMCGFLITAIQSGILLWRKKKDWKTDFSLSILNRIILLISFAFSAYLIVFSVYFMINDLEPLAGSQWTDVAIGTAIAAPIVVIALITADVLYNKRRKKKKEQEEQDKKLRKEFEELNEEE